MARVPRLSRKPPTCYGPGAVPYAESMFANQVTLLIAGVLVLAAGGVSYLWIRRRRRAGDLLHDAGVSTLVFPPEAKFQPSGLPRQ